MSYVIRSISVNGEGRSFSRDIPINLPMMEGGTICNTIEDVVLLTRRWNRQNFIPKVNDICHTYHVQEI